MKNIMAKIVMFVCVMLTGSVLADGTPLRLYTDREQGDTQFYIIPPSSINYLHWDEDEKLMTIITENTKHGESKFMVPIRSNEDAERFIEILMGKKVDRWLSADHK